MPADAVPLICIGVLVFVLVVAAGLLVAWLCDVGFSKLVYVGEGMILSKSHTPAHSERYTMWIMVGKTMVPMPRTRWVPDSWDVEVELDGDVRSASTDKETWNRLSRGVTCDVLAQQGWLATYGYEVRLRGRGC